MTARWQALGSDSAGCFCLRILSWLALWEISCTVFLRRSWIRRLAMSGHKACKPDTPKSVKIQSFSLDEKCGSWTRARKISHPRQLRERLDMPRLPFTHIAINRYNVFLSFYQHDDDKLIFRNFEFLPTFINYVIAINRYHVILGSFAKNTLYSETWLLRTLKGNEKRCVLNKVRFIQNKESAKEADWRCPWSTEGT